MAEREKLDNIEPLSRRDFLKLAGSVGALAIVGCEDAPKEEDVITPHIQYLERKEITGETSLLQPEHWRYMPGGLVNQGGLELHPLGMQIVNKRLGPPGGPHPSIPNPPFNALGPRLHSDGDVAINMTVQTDQTLVQIFGKPPIRFDDFRYEQSRIDLHFTPGEIRLEIWARGAQTPSVLTFASLDEAPLRNLEIRTEGEHLVFLIDGKPDSKLREPGLLTDGDIWFGASSESPDKTALISKLTARPLSGRLEMIDGSSLRVDEDLSNSLHNVVKKPGFHVGAAISLNQLAFDDRYAQLMLGGTVKRLTPENGFKPQDMQPSRGKFNLAEADAYIRLAELHDLEIHGHTLVYPSAQAEWMTKLPTETEAEKAEAREVFENHIRTVVRSLKGRVKAWDVVNEAIAGFVADAKLAENVWHRAYGGEEYIARAFEIAHEEDPDAELWYNDFGMDSSDDGRWNVMYDMIKRLVERGVPIHGVGFQGHVYELPRDEIKAEILRERFAALEKLGLKVRVSELDVTGADPDEQAKQYETVAQVGIEAPNCVGITVWGLTDAYGSTSRIENGNHFVTGDNLLYDKEYQPKKAFKAFREALAA